AVASGAVGKGVPVGVRGAGEGGGAAVNRHAASADHPGEAAAVVPVAVGEDHRRHRLVADFAERRHGLGGGPLAAEAVDDHQALGAFDHGHGGLVVAHGHVDVVGHAHDRQGAGGD